jgi:(1->4)-alpha-D-glucan 1-alpha-D-glucosylmutase
MEKALNEAKLHTSWINPNAEYNAAMERFVTNALEPSPTNAFLEDFLRFQAPVARAGMWNSTSQLLLKIASPGAPDFYPGDELWNFVLVDPDNRSPVDFQSRKNILSTIRQAGSGEKQALLERLIANPCDGAVKLYLIRRALCFRRTHPELFADGSYTSIMVDRLRSNHAVAFARSFGDQIVIAVAGRFFSKLCEISASPIGEVVWADTGIVLPKKFARPVFQEVFTGRTIRGTRQNGQTMIPLSETFGVAPFALLFSAGPTETVQ